MNNQELFSTGESTPLTLAERVEAVAKAVAKDVTNMIARELREAVDRKYIKDEAIPEVTRRIVDDLSQTIAQKPPTSLGEFSGLGTLGGDAEQTTNMGDTPRLNFPV